MFFSAHNIRRSYKTFISEVITFRQKWTKVKPSTLDVSLFNRVDSPPRLTHPNAKCTTRAYLQPGTGQMVFTNDPAGKLLANSKVYFFTTWPAFQNRMQCNFPAFSSSCIVIYLYRKTLMLYSKLC